MPADYAAFQSIPTGEQWRRLTARPRGLLRRRSPRDNPYIQQIDQCVDAHTARYAMASPHGQASILIALIVACCEWLKDKEGAASFRRAFVHQLARLAVTDLIVLDRDNFSGLNSFPNLMHLPAARERVLNALKLVREARAMEQWGWLKQRTQRLGFAPGLKTLHSDYWKETIAVPGPDGKQYNLYGHLTDKELKRTQGGHALTEKTYAQAAREYLAGLPQDPTLLISKKTEARLNVWYFDDEDRALHELLFIGDTAYYVDETGEYSPVKILSMRGPSKGMGLLYASDIHGNIYAARPNEGEAHNRELRHSSFFAGRAVQCAGFISFQNGIIRYVDNDSGHYRPSSRNFLTFLQHLRSRLSPRTFNAIRVYDSDPSYPKKLDAAEINAAPQTSLWVYANHYVNHFATHDRMRPEDIAGYQ